MSKTKKRLLIIIGIFAVIAVLYLVVMQFNGSVLHKLALREQAKEYVTEKYGEGFVFADTVYDFTDGMYLCQVTSEDSMDLHFTVHEANGGLEDDYAWVVEDKQNTISRLLRTFDEVAETEFPHAYPRRLLSAACSFADKPDSSLFALDMPADIQSPPQPLSLYLVVETQLDTPDWEELADCFRDAVQAADELGWPVTLFSCELTYKAVTEKPADAYSGICAYEVPRTVIEGDGLAEYLAAQEH